MDKKLILAVAGAGKTYTLCNEIDKKKNNIIIAYTNQNIRNLERELYKRFGYMPENTKVMTFHSFVYRYVIRPYEQNIAHFYGCKGYRSKGLILCDPPAQCLLGKGGYRYRNPDYESVDTLGHYFKNYKYYCAYLSKLANKTISKDFNLIDTAIKNVNSIVDKIYIDEFQDFREEDHKLLLKIITTVDKILLVGDFYQHSVSGKNNSGIPFKLKRPKRELTYQGFIDCMKEQEIYVDIKSLAKSRRCSCSVCKLVKEKLNIDIDYCCESDKSAAIRLIDTEEEIKKIINDNNCIKLVNMNSKNYNCACINWGYSKGDTYDKTCVVLIKAFYDILENSFSLNGIKQSTINKFYVALTRAKHEVYLVKDFVYNEVYKNNDL